MPSVHQAGARQPAVHWMRRARQFAHEPLRAVAASNEMHWRRGVGTFLAVCPAQRLDGWANQGCLRRAQTGARILAGAGAQLAVSLTDGTLAAVAIGCLLLVRQRRAAQRVTAQHVVPLSVLFVAVQVGLQLGGALVLCAWLRAVSRRAS